PSDRDEAIFKRLSGEEFPDIEGIGELNNILKKACHKEPAKRYQNAHEMKEALEQLINKTENIKQEEKINIDTNAEKTNNNFQKENMKEKVYQDFSERTQNIFNEENGKMNDSYSKEDNFYTVDYERKVIEYVIREFYVKEGIDLYYDTMALSRVYDEVKKQLSLSKDYPIIINIPHLIVTNTGVKSLYVKINKEDIQQTTQSTKKTQYTETKKRIRTITNKMSTL
ncbi:Hsp70 family protein, partial [Massilimicrobiota timonensis]|uniref:Hsp70 family protein n=1 Tax=Massilimicrobiota timonensis TaxID=1776392 RepID=UPI00195F9A6B